MLRRVVRAAAEHTDRLIVGLGAAMLVAYLAATILMPKPNGRVVVGDATHYFVQLRSAVFDHDLDFKNDYMRIYGLTRYEPGTEWIFTDLTVTGHVRNYMPVGPAILWAPLYLLVAGVQLLLSFAGLAARPDGFDRALQIVPGVTGVMASTAAAWMSWRLARRWTDPTSAAVGTIAVWLGSSALYYSLVSPSYSHAGSMFACALFFAHWLRPSTAPWSVGRTAASGALAGVATLMRWQDALLLAIPMYELLRSQMPWRRRAIAAVAAVVAWAMVFSPQMAVWHTLYGRWLAMPQGGSFMHWTAPHLLDVLLSDNHGLFSWTPIVACCLIGLATFAWRRRRFALPLAGIVLSAWYVNAAVADWWGGEAFGARRFLSLFPLFVLGLSTWIGVPGARRLRVAIACALTVATMLLLFQYEVLMKGHPDLAPSFTGWNLWIGRFVVPFRVVARWLA